MKFFVDFVIYNFITNDLGKIHSEKKMNDEKLCYFDLSLVSIEKSVLITFYIRLMTYYF